MDAEKSQELGPVVQSITAPFKNGNVTALSKFEMHLSSSSHLYPQDPQEVAAV